MARESTTENSTWTILLLIPYLATICVILFRIPYIGGVLLFHGVPGAYLAVRNRHFVLRAIAFSLFASLPLATLVDYIGTVNSLWLGPPSMFPRFLGIISLEEYAWMITGTFKILMVWNLARPVRDRNFSLLRVQLFTIVAAFLLAAFFALQMTRGESFFEWHSRYLYFTLGTVFFALPSGILGAHSPKSLKGALPAISYFFYVTCIFECVAIYASYWTFAGAYALPPLHVVGGLLPVEELVFVGIVGSSLAVLLYELLTGAPTR